MTESLSLLINSVSIHTIITVQKTNRKRQTRWFCHLCNLRRHVAAASLRPRPPAPGPRAPQTPQSEVTVCEYTLRAHCTLGQHDIALFQVASRLFPPSRVAHILGAGLGRDAVHVRLQRQPPQREPLRVCVRVVLDPRGDWRRQAERHALKVDHRVRAARHAVKVAVGAVLEPVGCLQQVPVVKWSTVMTLS